MFPMEEEFKGFMEDFESGKFETFKDIPTHIWGCHGWEHLSEKKLHEILLPLIVKQIERAKKYMKVYKDGFKNIDPKKIETMEDFWQIPALVKDSGIYGKGFREKVRVNPYILLPEDITSPVMVYKSGGTKGVATPTFITRLDREIESYGFARGYRYEGMKKGDIALSTYNPTHKGGEEIKEAFLLNGMTYVPRRNNESPKDVIKIIQDYNVNVLLTVQPPLDRGDRESKGVGVDLMSLIEEGQDVLESKIKLIFLGGYRLVDEAIEWAEAFNKPLVTLLGSSEAIPQATNTGFGVNSRLCKYNNLHVLNGPHFIEVIKEEDGVLVPVKKGETGILVYTTVAREGTIYIRYVPGDQAKVLANYGECPCGIKSPVITDVMRIDHPEDILTAGCVIG